MKQKKNILIFSGAILFCLLNQKIKYHIPNKKWFMTCYFNDIVGGIGFVAYYSYFFDSYKRRSAELIEIEILMLFCGIFWEYITPLFRNNTVSDPWDIVAYLSGGFLYWVIIKKKNNRQGEIDQE